MSELRKPGGLEWLALALVLALALGLRLYKADTALWYDEIYTVVNSIRLPFSELIASYESLNNHMLYSLSAKLSVAALGESEVSVRLPAILFGVGSIFVQWRISRRITGPVAALIVALLLTLSYHHVWFSQNARGYTGLLFFTSAATLAFINGMERPGWKTWTVYGLLVAAAMYMHMSAGFFFVAHGAVYAFMLGRRLLARTEEGQSTRWPGMSTILPVYGVALSIVVTLFLYAPIIGKALQTVGEVAEASNSEGGAALAEWRNPLRAVAEIGASISSMGPLVPFILVGAVLVLAVGLRSLWKRHALLTAIYVVHVPLAMVLLYLVGVRIWPRYFFVDIGFIFMALVEGVFVWSGMIARWFALSRRWPGAASTIAWVGVAAMTAISIGLLVRNYAYPKQDYVGARDYVLAHAAPEDRIAAVALAGYSYRNYYAPRWDVVENSGDMERLRANTAGVMWVLMAFPHQTQAGRPDVAAELKQHFDEVATFPGTLGDGAIWVYRSREAR